MPEADASGAIMLGVNVAHIRLGDASILVDPGFDDPSVVPPAQFPGLVRSAGLIPGLRSVGVEPDTITHVLITHTHDDHYAGVTVMRDGRRVAAFRVPGTSLGVMIGKGTPMARARTLHWHYISERSVGLACLRLSTTSTRWRPV